jgi:hypothetical protein
MALSHSPSIVTQGLVLYLDAANRRSYPETGTGWFDLSGLGNNGTFINGPNYNSLNGGSIIFDGVDDYIQINHNTTLNSLPLTMNAWIYMESGASGIDIINKYASGSVNGYRMGISSGGLGIYYFGGSINDGLWSYDSYSGTINFSQWNMVTATIDSSGGILYINGNQVGTRYWNGSALPPSTTNPLRIGTYNLTNGYFNGKITSVKIYNRALSSQQIQQNFNALRGRFGI